jgi:hypothetical protein
VATAGEIVTAALRTSNILSIGAAPSADEEAEGIARLNAIVGSLFGEELGTHLRDWDVVNSWSDEQEERHPLTPVTGDETLTPWKYPPLNARLVVKIVSPVTIYLPGTPLDGSRLSVADVGSSASMVLHASGRLIEGSAFISRTLALLHGTEWFYRADLANWLKLEPITDAADTLPLPAEFDDFFITTLAMVLATRYGTPIEETVAQRQVTMQERVISRYKPGATQLSPAELRNMLRTTP